MENEKVLEVIKETGYVILETFSDATEGVWKDTGVSFECTFEVMQVEGFDGLTLRVKKESVKILKVELLDSSDEPYHTLTTEQVLGVRKDAVSLFDEVEYDSIEEGVLSNFENIVWDNVEDNTDE